MGEKLFYTFQIVSTFSVTLPLAAGFLTFKNVETKLKLFLVFLSLGFIADLLGWYFYLTKNAAGNIYARDIYSLIETLFLIWFIGKVSNNRIIKSVSARLWIVLIPVWMLGIIYKDVLIVCRTSSQVLLAFVSCFCLLEIVEKRSLIAKDLIFWILLGIFFYFFSTFFFMSLLATQLDLKVWYLHNLLNIATNLIYFWGFLKILSTNFIASKRAPY
jgi:hypothetical protein